jgi:hypothetical protein
MSLQGLSTVVTPLLNRDTQAADNGIYYSAISPTPGTGIVNTVNMTSLAIAELAPFLNVYNGSPASQPVTIYPLYLRLTMTAANAASGGTLGLKFTFTLDQGNRVTTIPAAAGILTINNCNMGSPNRSQAQIYGNANALITSAPTSQRRIVGHVSPRPTVLGVVGDVYQFNFGSTEQIDPSSLTPGGTSIANVTYGLAPFVIGQNQTLGVNVWAVNNTTAPAFEVEFGFLEK